MNGMQTVNQALADTSLPIKFQMSVLKALQELADMGFGDHVFMESYGSNEYIDKYKRIKHVNSIGYNIITEVEGAKFVLSVIRKSYDIKHPDPVSDAEIKEFIGGQIWN